MWRAVDSAELGAGSHLGVFCLHVLALAPQVVKPGWFANGWGEAAAVIALKEFRAAGCSALRSLHVRPVALKLKSFVHTDTLIAEEAEEHKNFRPVLYVMYANRPA